MKKPSSLVKALILAMGIGGCCMTTPPKPKASINDLVQGTVCIRNVAHYVCNGEPVDKTASGSGFVYATEDDGSYIMSAAHVFDNPEVRMLIPGVVCILDSEESYVVDHIFDDNPDDDVGLQIKELDKNLDFAILESEIPLFVPNYSIPEGNTYFGDKVLVMGYPRGLQPFVSSGTIGHPYAVDILSKGDTSLLDATILGGMSGGPYFTQNDRGEYEFRGVCLGSLANGPVNSSISICLNVKELLKK